MYFKIASYLFFTILSGFSGSIIWISTSELINKRKMNYDHSSSSCCSTFFNIPIKHYYNYGLLLGLCIGFFRAYLGKSLLEYIVQP